MVSIYALWDELSLVDAEVPRSRQPRRVNVQTDQVGSRILQVRHPMNVAAPRHDDRAGREAARTRHDQLASAVGQERGFRGHSLDDENPARRLAVVVDRTALAAPPAEYQDLVAGGVMDQVSLISSLVEVSAPSNASRSRLNRASPLRIRFSGMGPASESQLESREHQAAAAEHIPIRQSEQVGIDPCTTPVSTFLGFLTIILDYSYGLSIIVAAKP